MSAPADEFDFWDGKAATLKSAVEAIAADESAWRGEVLEKCLAQILPALDTAPHRKGHGPRVLDLGCGAGRLLVPLAKRRPDWQLIGVDISPAMLLLGAEWAAAHAAAWGRSPRWLPCDGRTLPPTMGRIDAAYSMIMLQHIPLGAQERYLREVADALVKGGIFRFQGLEGEESTFLHHYITETWVHRACHRAGFKVEAIDRMRPFNDNPDAPNALWVTAVKR